MHSALAWSIVHPVWRQTVPIAELRSSHETTTEQPLAGVTAVFDDSRLSAFWAIRSLSVDGFIIDRTGGHGEEQQDRGNNESHGMAPVCETNWTKLLISP
jgi:hypothetical protein